MDDGKKGPTGFTENEPCTATYGGARSYRKETFEKGTLSEIASKTFPPPKCCEAELGTFGIFCIFSVIKMLFFAFLSS